MVDNLKAGVRPWRYAKGHLGAVYCVCITPDGSKIISGSGDKSIRIYDNCREGTSTSIRKHDAGVKSIALSLDGSLLLSGSDDRKLQVFKMAN